MVGSFSLGMEGDADALQALGRRVLRDNDRGYGGFVLEHRGVAFITLVIALDGQRL